MQNHSHRMRRLIAADLLPERAGQPVKALAHISLADLMMLEGSSALLQEWTTRVRAQWAAHRAAASAAGGDGGAWLDGDAARAFTCDASLTPVVTAEVDLAALDDLIRLCAQLYKLGRHHGGDGTLRGSDGPAASHPGATGAREALEQAIIGKAADLLSGPGGLASFLFCAAGSSAPGWAARACRWTSGPARTSRPRSAAPSSCATSTAGSPAAATSPPPPARCTT